MGDTFGGGSSSSETEGIGPVADGSTYGSNIGSGSSTSGIGPVANGSEYGSNLGSAPSYTPPTTSTADQQQGGGTNWGGLLQTGVGLVGAASSIYKQNQDRKLAEEQLKQGSVSQETKDVAESTYRQNRVMMLQALQNFYAARGWTMPTPGGGSPTAGTSAPASSRPNQSVNTALPTDGTDGSETTFSVATPEQRANAATGGTPQNTAPTPNAQQKTAAGGPLLPVNAKEAFQSKSAKKGESTGDKVVGGISTAANIVGKGAAIYNAAFNKTIQNGGTESQASAAGSEAASNSGFSAGQILGYTQAAIGAYRALTDKNASGAQKTIGVAQAANSAYGSSGGGSTAGYIGAGLRGAQVLAGNKGTDQQKATRAQQEVGLGIADMSTYGLATPVEGMARQNKTTGKLLGKVDQLDAKTNPITKLYAHFGSSKGEDQMISDQIRKSMLDNGVIQIDPTTKKWNIYLTDQNGNRTAFDIGADGKGGRKAHELDEKGFFEKDGTTPSLQGRITGRASALADLVTGGDEKQGTKFAGYFANAGLKAAKGDEETGRAVMRDLYNQMGYKDAASAIAGIEALRKAGKIDEQRARSQMNSIRDTFGSSEAPQQNEAERTRPKPQQNQEPKQPPRSNKMLLRQGDDDARKALEQRAAR